MNFTGQGIRKVKESPVRFKAFRAMAEKLGVAIKSCYWTVGNYDIVMVLEGPEEAVTSVLLNGGSLGNVRSQTLRAFTVDEMKRMLSKIP